MYTWASSDHGRGAVVGRQEWRRGRSKETPGKREPTRARGGRLLVVARITLLRLGRGNYTHTCSDSVQWFAVGWGACLVTAGDGRKYAQKAFHYITAMDW